MYKVLLTAIGCPNGYTAIKHLQRYGVHVIGADARAAPVAASLVDKFYTVPLANSSYFIDEIFDIVDTERPDVLVSQSEDEVAVLTKYVRDLDTRVLVATPPDAVHVSMDKWAVYDRAEEIGVPVPTYFPCTDHHELLLVVRKYLCEFGSAIVRPTRGKGSRGLRIVVPHINRVGNRWQKWPDAAHISMVEMESCDLTKLHYPLIVSEPMQGEVAFEGYVVDGKVLTGYLKQKRREVGNASPSHTHNTCIEDDDLTGYAHKLVADFGGHSFVDVQFIQGKLMEINPRLSTQIYTPDYNMIHFGILHTLGLMSDSEIAEKRLPLGKTAEFFWDLHYD